MTSTLAWCEFLTCWQAQNYGHMAKHAVNLVRKPVSKLAGDLRASGELARLTRFDLRVVRQPNAALAEADVYMEGDAPNGAVRGVFKVLAERDTEDGNLAMPTDPGRWCVRQSCVVDLMQGPTIGDSDPR